jgi:F-type H+-transporting ATPase subunit b
VTRQAPVVVRAAACETPRKLLRAAGVCVLAIWIFGSTAPIAAQPEPGREPPAAGERHGEEPHQDSLINVIARLVNFGILAGSLVYLLRSPLAAYLANRDAQIRSDLVNAAELKQAAAAQIDEIDRKMKALPGELEALRRQGLEEIAAEEARIQAAAAAERDRLLEQARREIALQVKVAERELVSHAAELAVGVATERIKKNITGEDQQRLLDRYVQQLGSAPNQ